MNPPYLNSGLPQPLPAPDGLDAAFWQGLTDEKLLMTYLEALLKKAVYDIRKAHTCG